MVDGSTHKRTCSVCGKEETATHNWDSGKVTKFATCKEEGIKTFTCQICKTTRTEVVPKTIEHTYQNNCDVDCDVCGAIRTITHKYQTSWSKDKSGHWHACSGCEEKGSFEAHTFDNACDTDCNTCGFTRDTKHTYKTEWFKDGNGHWHECSICGAKADEAAHIPGPEATETTAQICTECSYQLDPATGTTEPSTPNTPTTPDNPAGNNNVGDIMAFVVIICVVLGMTGVAIILIIREKKRGK